MARIGNLEVIGFKVVDELECSSQKFKKAEGKEAIQLAFQKQATLIAILEDNTETVIKEFSSF